MLNKLRCHTHFWFSANQITWYRLLIKIHILNYKQCRSRSDGFFRNQLFWIYTDYIGRVYPGSAGKFAKLPVFNSKYYFQLSSESVAVTVEVSVPSSRRRRAAGGRKAALNQLNYQKGITGLIDALTVPSVLSVQGKRTYPANNVVTTSLQCRCNVVTLQQHCNDVGTLCVCWVIILVYRKAITPYHTCT